MRKTVMIIAGEASGDKHAAHLAESLKAKSDVRLVGIGGDRMKAAGVELIHHVKEMSVMGFAEVFTKLPFLRKVRRDLIAFIRDESPSGVILVDYPGFNLRFAGIAKKAGLRVIYYISPQIWAWGKGRIKRIRRTVDLMLTIFRFEEDMYREEGVNAVFVGHPLIDETKFYDVSERDGFRKLLSVRSDSRLLALFPGSRLQEIRKILPTMLEAVTILKKQSAESGLKLEVVIGCAPGIDKRVYEDIIGGHRAEVALSDDADLLMSSADAGLVKSGTSTLEAVLHNLPIVVVYRTGALNYFIGRMLVKLNSISLVNIVAGKLVVEELIQNDFTPAKAAASVGRLFTDQHLVDDIRQKYAGLRAILGDGGASDRAAELILNAI